MQLNLTENELTMIRSVCTTSGQETGLFQQKTTAHGW